MKERRLNWTARAIALLVLLAAVLLASSASAESATVALSDRILVELSAAPALFSFTVPSNSTYTFRSFGGEGAHAVLSVGADRLPVASGDGLHFTERLAAGKQYTLAITGTSGEASVEIMRNALGRSFDRPLELKNLGDSYAKIVARAEDVHWYRFKADATGPCIIATRGAIPTEGLVTDEHGNALKAISGQALPYDRNFALQLNLIKGNTYYLRVWSPGDSTGRYTLRFIRGDAEAPVPDSISLSASSMDLQIGQHAQLSATVRPEGAASELLWVSTDPRVATVSESGRVTAVGAGECEVVALGFGRASASCRVAVRAAELTRVQFEQRHLQVPVGEQLPLKYQLEPEGATGIAPRFSSSDESIATVDSSGNLTAHATGTAEITLSAGALRDSLAVTVVEQPPKRRALILGEQRYLDGRVRLGAVNTTQGMADLFSSQSFDGAGYEVTMRMDTGRSKAIAAIREVFRDAKSGDVSLFAINCHGGYENGTPYLEFYDGTKLSAQGLEAELRKIPGTVVVIIDCCNSGAFISRVERSQFTSRMLAAFGTDRSGSFAMSKYRVICSSSAIQESYRTSPKRKMAEAYISTALARALCLAGGWDIDSDREISIKADANHDGAVTLEEAYQYSYKRVKLYLKNSADMQDVQIYPRGSQFVLFSRE